MKGTRILAFACSMLMIGNQIPASIVPVYAVNETEVKTINIDEAFVDSLIVADKIYDGTTDAKIDCSKVTIKGVDDGDDINLSATAMFNDSNVGNDKVVKISEIKIEGPDKDKYNLNFDPQSVECIGKITPAVIHLIPTGNFVEGEKLPKEIEYDYNSKDILQQDNVNITAKVSVSKDESGNYVYIIDNPNATGNPNYTLAIAEDDAPIPSDSMVATLSKVEITKEDATELEQYNFGIVADGSVKITVYADLTYNMPITFTLSDGQTVTDDAPIFDEQSKSYKAHAEFILGLDEDETSQTFELSCKIENGDKSEDYDLQLKVNENQSTVSKLIIDRQNPNIDELKAENNSCDHLYCANGKFSDNETGIKTIKYRWDYKLDSNQQWEIYNNNNFSHDPGTEVSFYTNRTWNSPNSTEGDEHGNHYFEIEITDNAGNKTTKEYITNGADTQAPIVTYIRLEKKIDSAWKKVINCLSFGNFINSDLTLLLKVEDTAESESDISGVKSVELVDGSDENAKLISEKAILTADKEGMYSYTVSPDININSWNVRLTDNVGCSKCYSIKSLLQSDVAKEEQKENIITGEIEEKTTETMDWSALKSDKWIFDKTSPEIEFPNKGKVGEDDSVLYYNNEGGNLTIDVTDDGSLKNIKVIEEYKLNDTGKYNESEIYSSDSFSSITLSKQYQIDTKKLKTGWYKYTVTAQDFAGNSESVKSIEIYVDHAEPTGAISVIDPISPNFVDLKDESSSETQNWIREKDSSGNYVPVTFRFDAYRKGSKIKKMTLDIVGKNDQFKHFEFFSKKGQITEEDSVYYVTAMISTDPSSENYLEFTENNIYEVKAQIEAASCNKSQEISYTLHVDTENPVVENFNVEKKNSAARTILNVLTFGVFANDSLKFTVKVKDGQNDIGLDHVNISYIDVDNKKVSKEMNGGEGGVYTCELDIDTKVFQSNIVVEAVDKISKSSKNAPNIQNTTGDKQTQNGNTFVMLETVTPTLQVVLPPTDSSTRSNDQIWYRQHTNSDSDSEKYIEVIAQDTDSGIQQINMVINGTSVDHIVSGGQSSNIVSNIERDNKKLLDYDSSKTMGENSRTSLCDEFHFFYSTESIANKVSANSDGSYVIEFEVIDNAGNVTTTPVNVSGISYSDSKVVYYRDVALPNVVQFIFDPASIDDISQVNQDDFIQKLEYGYYFKKSFDVMIISNDSTPSSGLDSAIFRLVSYENGKFKSESISTPVQISNGVAKYTIPAGFKGQIYGKVYDKVNNTSEECTPQGFVVDETAPTITIEPLPEQVAGKDASQNNIYTDMVQFRVTISDIHSGLQTIRYSKSSELDSYDEVITNISNDAGSSENKSLDNGWEITGTDVNLVTEVSRVFTFDKDDNDISMTFEAMDRSGNECEPKSSEKFTIDTIAPQISIVNNSQLLNELYYNGSTQFTITVTERNFSPDLIVGNIKNNFTNAIPTISFSTDENNNSIHTATVIFPEGDYSFSLSGSDMAGHRAIISYNGGEANEFFTTAFNVDTTAPRIQTNFKNFGKDNDKSVYFNKGQTAEIIVTEHNFVDSDMGIVVEYKSPGSSHISDGTWNELGYDSSKWVNEGDKHTLSISLTSDGVYRIRMNPKDRAGNSGEFATDSPDHTTIFELDSQSPTYEKRNDESSSDKGFVKTPFYDIYDEKRKDEAYPTVEFDDVNFDRIEVTAVVYTPTYENGKELDKIEMSPIYKQLSHPVSSKKFTLTDFDQDGVYALTFVAVDKAGNKSEPINNTYFRMVNTDVLAYIYNSQIGDKNSDDKNKQPSGYYSLMNTDGKAISKKASDFEDLDILVIKPTSDKQAGRLVLRQDEEQYSPYDYNAFNVEEEFISETATMVKMHLPGEYFSETFRDDGLNARMYLSVSIREDIYLDLASIHIDNEAPTASIPDEFKNWHNYFFENEHTVTLSNVSEILDDKKSKVYECPRNGDRVEIPYIYDSESGTFSFTLSKGVHHIDISLVDEAGNEWNVNRVKYVRVGNFRLYLGLGMTLGISAIIVFTFIKRKKRN